MQIACDPIHNATVCICRMTCYACDGNSRHWWGPALDMRLEFQNRNGMGFPVLCGRLPATLDRSALKNTIQDALSGRNKQQKASCDCSVRHPRDRGPVPCMRPDHASLPTCSLLMLLLPPPGTGFAAMWTNRAPQIMIDSYRLYTRQRVVQSRQPQGLTDRSKRTSVARHNIAR